MTTIDLTHDLLAAGYTVHQASNDDGTCRCWADHGTGTRAAHVYMSGFGDFDQLVTADLDGRHETFTPATAAGLLAAAKLAAAHVDATVAA